MIQSLAFMNEIPDDRNHVIQTALSHSRIKTDPEGVVHNVVRILKFANNPVIRSFNQMFKAGMFGQIASKKIAGLNVMRLQIFDQIVTAEFRLFCQGDQKTEPGGIALRIFFKQPNLRQIFKSVEKAGEIRLALFHESGKLFQLGAAAAACISLTLRL